MTVALNQRFSTEGSWWILIGSLAQYKMANMKLFVETSLEDGLQIIKFLIFGSWKFFFQKTERKVGLRNTVLDLYSNSFKSLYEVYLVLYYLQAHSTSGVGNVRPAEVFFLVRGEDFSA